MGIVYGVLVVLAIILCLLLFTKISLQIKVLKNSGREFKTSLDVAVFGKKIDFSKFKKQNKKAPENPGQKKEVEGEKEKEEKKSLSERLHNLRINIEQGRYTYLLSKRYVRKKIKIEKLNFSMTFGLDDAAHTGIATGIAWGSVYNLFGFIDGLCTVKSHNFNITPVFDGECFEMSFETEVKLSLSNILAIAVAVLTNYIKSKIKIRKG